MPMFALEAARLTPKSAKRTVVVFAESKGRLTPAAQIIDEGLDGLVRATLRASRYQGGAGEFTRITVQNHAISQVIVAGLGKGADDRRDYWKSGLAIGKQLDALGVKEATIALGELDSAEAAFEAATAVIEGVHMALYRFEQFKEVKEHNAPRFERLIIHTSTRTARMIEEETANIAALLEATDVTRTAVNLPPNIANPEYMAEQARKLEKFGIKVEVIDEKQMKKLGLNLILAVGGNAAPEDQPRLILMHYNGGAKGEAPQAIVGKGVMFDTGGYNIKINASMGGMKFDMAGSAAVLGTMEALARRKAPINVIGVMACAMNMIGQVPFLPDSIYKSYKGLFVEIGNTDAEGRLVLADAIAYTIDKYQPEQLVDLATLTGACMAALGGAYAGLFSTSNSLANALSRAGDDVGERLWRMPIDDFYAAPTDTADVNNNGSPYGGASTGAVFIKRFADKTPWAHLDIAGVANAEKLPGGNKSLTAATGFGVRLLVNWLEGIAAASAAPSGKKRGRPARSASAVIDADAPKRGRGRPEKPPNKAEGGECMAKLVLPPYLTTGTKGVEGVLTPSIPAEAGIHEGRPQIVATKFFKSEILPAGVAPQRPLAHHGNPTIEIPPLYYNPTEQTGWIYIVASKPNGIIYVGQTTNLPYRAFQHKEGKIDGFTKKYGCKTLVYFEGYQLITESIARETAMKEWSRAWKVRRIVATNPEWRDLYPEICEIG